MELTAQDLFSQSSSVESTPDAVEGADATDGNENPCSDLKSLSLGLDLNGRWLSLRALSWVRRMNMIINDNLRL